MDSTYFSLTSVEFQRSARRCIAEGRTLHDDRCENPRSHIFQYIQTTKTRYSYLDFLMSIAVRRLRKFLAFIRNLKMHYCVCDALLRVPVKNQLSPSQILIFLPLRFILMLSPHLRLGPPIIFTSRLSY
jgi:hypothetical protein